MVIYFLYFPCQTHFHFLFSFLYFVLWNAYLDNNCSYAKISNNQSSSVLIQLVSHFWKDIVLLFFLTVTDCNSQYYFIVCMVVQNISILIACLSSYFRIHIPFLLSSLYAILATLWVAMFASSRPNDKRVLHLLFHHYYNLQWYLI